MNEMDVAFVCKALGDSNRLRIVKMLSNGEKCACKLLEEFDITQPTLSHHMRILSECELIQTRKDGRWSYYSLSCETIAAFKDFVSSLACCEDGDCTCK